MQSLIKTELDVTIDRTHYWSDSMIVLQYIANDDKRYHTYVANRLEIIRDGSNASQWHHVDTKSNPADHASRGLSARQLNSQQWLHGPAFLSQPDTQWPQFNDTHLDASDPEVKKQAQVFTVTPHQSPTDQLLHAFSTWHKLRTSVAWLLVLTDVLHTNSGPIPRLDGCLMKRAETSVVRYVQQTVFPDEVSDLVSQKEVSKASRLSSLKPFLQNGVIQVGGRLVNAPIDDNMKHPIIMPGEHHVTQLLIRNEHEISGHCGREYLLAELQQRYWIIGARAAIRKVIGGCVQCKRRDKGACQQQMADLPADRVTPGDPAFTHSGVDMFGPISVKRGRGTEKRYGCLFTCLTTRAVHIEVAHSLGADSFVKCLQRFIARRGKMKSLRSDNGTNFICAERELRQEVQKMDMTVVQNALNRRNIEWKFNPPSASHFGGVWERQIRTVKRVLAGLTKEQRMTDESLLTFMCVAEGIVNNRPITATSTDPNDLSPLTPSHFLILRPTESLTGTFDEDCLRKNWRQIEYMANVFWKRWVREYLPQLQARTKWVTQSRNVECGDLVLIMDYSIPRNQWLMGRVIETYQGQDNQVRSVKIKTSRAEFTRPIAKVCLLESVQAQPPKHTGPLIVNEE